MGHFVENLGIEIMCGREGQVGSGGRTVDGHEREISESEYLLSQQSGFCNLSCMGQGHGHGHG